jgi:hypothetical protein
MRPLLLAMLLAGLAATAQAGREFVAEVEDFRCLTDGVRAPGKSFFIFHEKRAALRRAVRKTKRAKLGKGYPVGTILQLFPFEAMVKRGGGFNPEGDGWEYFSLRIGADGATTILARGGAEVTGLTGTSCQGCHMQLAAEHDSVCEFVVGAAGLGLTGEQIAAFQANDPRCRADP